MERNLYGRTVKQKIHLRIVLSFGPFPMKTFSLIYLVLQISGKSMEFFATSRISQERKMQALVRKSLNFLQLFMQWLNVQTLSWNEGSGSFSFFPPSTALHDCKARKANILQTIPLLSFNLHLAFRLCTARLPYKKEYKWKAKGYFHHYLYRFLTNSSFYNITVHQQITISQLDINLLNYFINLFI